MASKESASSEPALEQTDSKVRKKGFSRFHRRSLSNNTNNNNNNNSNNSNNSNNANTSNTSKTNAASTGKSSESTTPRGSSETTSTSADGAVPSSPQQNPISDTSIFVKSPHAPAAPPVSPNSPNSPNSSSGTKDAKDVTDGKDLKKGTANGADTPPTPQPTRQRRHSRGWGSIFSRGRKNSDTSNSANTPNTTSTTNSTNPTISTNTSNASNASDAPNGSVTPVPESGVSNTSRATGRQRSGSNPELPEQRMTLTATTSEPTGTMGRLRQHCGARYSSNSNNSNNADNANNGGKERKRVLGFLPRLGGSKNAKNSEESASAHDIGRLENSIFASMVEEGLEIETIPYNDGKNRNKSKNKKNKNKCKGKNSPAATSEEINAVTILNGNYSNSSNLGDTGDSVAPMALHAARSEPSDAARGAAGAQGSSQHFSHNMGDSQSARSMDGLPGLSALGVPLTRPVSRSVGMQPKQRKDSLTSFSRHLVTQMEEMKQRYDTTIATNLYDDPSLKKSMIHTPAQGATHAISEEDCGQLGQFQIDAEKQKQIGKTPLCGVSMEGQFVLTGSVTDVSKQRPKAKGNNKIIVKDDNLIEKIIFLVNTRSGGQHGKKFIKLFRIYPSIIYDLLECTLKPQVLHSLAHDIAILRERTVCIICGGDGSQHWGFQTIGKALKWYTKAHGIRVPYPKVAPFPIGTGNDLSRAVGWGNLERTDEKIIKYISDVYFCYGVSHRVTGLDRWKVTWHFPMLKRSIVDVVPGSAPSTNNDKDQKKQRKRRLSWTLRNSKAQTKEPPQQKEEPVPERHASRSESDSMGSPHSISVSEATQKFIVNAQEDFNQKLEHIDEKQGEPLNNLKMASLSAYDEEITTGATSGSDNEENRRSSDFATNPRSSSDSSLLQVPTAAPSVKSKANVVAANKLKPPEPEAKVEITVDSDYDASDDEADETRADGARRSIGKDANEAKEVNVNVNVKGRHGRTESGGFDDMYVGDEDDEYKDKLYEYRHSFNPPLPIGFVCYLTIGYDAIITNDFALDRQLNPSKYSSQIGNQLAYARLGVRDLLKPTDCAISKYVDLYVNKDYENKVEIPDNIRSLKLININSAANGMFFWGSGKSRPDELQECDPPRCDDGKIEVCASLGVQQIIKSKLNLKHAHRLAQVSDVRFVFKKAPFAIQIDGEGFIIQEQCSIDVSLYNHKVPMLIGYKSPKGVPFQYMQESYTNYVKHQRHLYRKYKRQQFGVYKSFNLRPKTTYRIETKTRLVRKKRPQQSLQMGPAEAGAAGVVAGAAAGSNDGVTVKMTEIVEEKEETAAMEQIDENYEDEMKMEPKGRQDVPKKRVSVVETLVLGPPTLGKKKSVANDYIEELENANKSDDSVDKDDCNIPEFASFAKAPYWEQIRKVNRMHLIDDVTACEMREALVADARSRSQSIANSPNKDGANAKTAGTGMPGFRRYRSQLGAKSVGFEFLEQRDGLGPLVPFGPAGTVQTAGKAANASDAAGNSETAETAGNAATAGTGNTIAPVAPIKPGQSFRL